MKTLTERLDRLLAASIIVILAALVAAVVWQVCSRYLLNNPSSATEEIARYLLIWVSFLGASYAYRRRMHISLDLLTRRLHGKPKGYVELLALSAVAVFAIAILILGGSSLVILTWQLGQVSAVLGISVSIVYTVIPLSGALILLDTIEFALDVLRGDR